MPALLGEDAAGLSPTTISRLTAAWDEEYEAFRHRDLSGCDYANRVMPASTSFINALQANRRQ